MRASQIHPLLVAAIAFVLGCGQATARERPATVPAALFLQDTIDRATRLVRPPVSAGDRSELARLIESAMDWPALARFAIGHFGAALNADEMSGVTRRLEQRVQSLAQRAGAELPAMTVAIHDLRIDPDGHRHIFSTATVPRLGEIEVEWTLAPSQTGYHITDIRAVGITLRQFLRSWIISLVAARGGDAAAAFGEAPVASPQ